MSKKSVFAWLSKTKTSWPWQTVLDTLAFGEGVPLRFVDLDSLEGFHGNLRRACDDLDVQPIFDVKSLGLDSPQEAFDRYIGSTPQAFEEMIETRIRGARELRAQAKRDTKRPEPYRKVGNERVFHPGELEFLDRAFPFLGRYTTQIFTANAIPLNFLSKLVMPYWRWYGLFWLYYRFVMEHPCQGNRQECSWQVCKDAFEVPGLYFVWKRLETDGNLILLAGPVFGSGTSPIREDIWENRSIQAAAFLTQLYSRTEGREGISVQEEERFLRAVQAEPPILQADLIASAERVADTLTSLDNMILPEDPFEPNATDLRLMTLWTLFLRQQESYLSLVHQQYMLEDERTTIGLRWTGPPEAIRGKSLFVDIMANAVTPGIGEKGGARDPLPDDGSGGFDFRLFLPGAGPGDSASRELLREFQPRFSRLLTRFHRNAASFNNERVLIMSDRLQDHLGKLVPDYPNAGDRYSSLVYRICTRIAELVRADIATLYEYDVVEEKKDVLRINGMYFSDASHHEYADALQAGLKEIADTDSRHRSVCYRAMDSRRQRIVLDYEDDPRRDTPISSDKPIYVPPGKGMPVFRSAIATPILFCGRILALLEVNALEPWMFRKDQWIGLRQIASGLSPFLFHHRYLRALQGIQDAVLRFHGDDEDQSGTPEDRENALYGNISKWLTGLFICHGAAIWVRDTEDTGRFIRKGFHNVARKHEQFGLGKGKSFVGWCVKQYRENGKIRFNRDIGDTDTPPVMKRQELLDADIGTLTVVLIPDDRKEVTAAITLYGKGAYEPYDAAWHGVMHFIGSHLSLVVEAVNTFISARQRYETLHVHELYHDAALIADKGKKLAHSMQGLKSGVKTLLEVLNIPRFKEELNSPLLDRVGRKGINALKDLPRQLDSRLFRVDKDLEYYSSTLLTRVKMLFGQHPLEPSSEKSRRFLQATGCTANQTIDKVNRLG